MEKPEEEKLADELFGVVAREIGRTMFRVDECGGIGVPCFVSYMANWQWKSKKNFLLTEENDIYTCMSFAKSVYLYCYDSLPERLKSMVDAILGSSTLEEIKLKFAVAGLLGENSRTDGA